MRNDIFYVFLDSGLFNKTPKNQPPISSSHEMNQSSNKIQEEDEEVLFLKLFISFLSISVFLFVF